MIIINWMEYIKVTLEGVAYTKNIRFLNELSFFSLTWGYGVAWFILSGLGPDDPGSN